MKAHRFQAVVPHVYRSPLPLLRELRAFAELGGRTVVDLTQRKRENIERWCERLDLVYVKHPMPYDGGDAERAASVILAAPGPVLLHCFHGRDRTGRVVAVIEAAHADR